MTNPSNPSERALLRLIAAGERLARARDLDAIAGILRDTAREVLGADGIAVVLRQGELCHYVAEDAVEPLWQGLRFPLGSCVSGWSMTHGQTVIIPDITTDPRVPQEAYRRTFVRSLIMAPIGTGEPVAALGAYWADKREHDPFTVMLLESLARSAALAIEHAQLNATLEHRVEERTRELEQAHEALRQSQKLEAIGQLTGGIAHDFNNLLTIIRSSVDFLRRPELPEERKSRYLDAVSDTVDRAAKLTGQLLAFARRQALKPEVFDAASKVRDIAEMLDVVTGARVRLVTNLPDGPCCVRADLSQFETALVNLAVNGRDAMDGEGTLTLRVTGNGAMPQIRGHSGTQGTFVVVSLTDTGTGVRADQIDRIFEPFYTTKEVGKGTGLGLSQVFGFVKQSGGDVDVFSEPGRGTTFTLYLPEVAAEVRLERKADRNDGPAPIGTNQRVLVVEDNVEVGQFCTQILEDLGYRTAWAATAEEALDRLGDDGNGFEVVFSDVIMPGMGGIALALELRQRLPSLPVILASGYSHALALDGAQGFELLHKPYSAEQLSKVLRERRCGGGDPSSPRPNVDGMAVPASAIRVARGHNGTAVQGASRLPETRGRVEAPRRNAELTDGLVS
ncbi:Sensor histidine kinase RcsC [Methylobacterium iners]|uniref:histidine kinase n=2 Tax=Methylobacterium iners TaxID=418707 RepID=A0ABQ4S7G0_9HYPH|nr:Sensor histidine kinase RcsC [Methylobacterium iners]